MQDQVYSVEGNNSKQSLLVKTVTWMKDTHSLFDYEFTKSINKNQMSIVLQPGFIFMYRNNSKSEIVFMRENEMKPKPMDEAQLLGCFQICGKDKKFKLLFHQPDEFQNFLFSPPVTFENQEISKIQKIFFIVRSLKDNNNEPKGYQFKSGQSLKVGRVQYAVNVKYKNEENACPQNQEQYFDYEEVHNANNLQKSSSDTCKICLSNEEYPNRYFFCRPCKCSGSLSLVHFECLYLWCQTKIKKESHGLVTQYNFSKFNCEICKSIYPRYVQKDQIKYDLMPLKKPQGTYMTLLEKQQTQLEKKLFMIEYNDSSELRIGRNHECEIRITDISISRKHGKIQMKNGNFYIFDTKSKFGTLICEPNLHIDLEMVKRGIQVGRTVATFELRSQTGSQ